MVPRRECFLPQAFKGNLSKSWVNPERERKREMIALTKHPNETAHHNEGTQSKNDPAKTICLSRGAGGDLLVDCRIKPTVSIDFNDLESNKACSNSLTIPFPSSVAAV